MKFQTKFNITNVICIIVRPGSVICIIAHRHCRYAGSSCQYADTTEATVISNLVLTLSVRASALAASLYFEELLLSSFYLMEVQLKKSPYLHLLVPSLAMHPLPEKENNYSKTIEIYIYIYISEQGKKAAPHFYFPLVIRKELN